MLDYLLMKTHYLSLSAIYPNRFFSSDDKIFESNDRNTP